ncbi:GTPase Era [Polymorphobacter sp. PAMC 29334]|uniref:GTPase Era n=1 Tax=Polymorphobacter sp. PAMC 29334 TaxID=2862331 RepID=UPI001C78550B|nr:GTPase Era [Polymorphobacter sp. PAMC 29334]QYE34054.1 GTPase Era [Polymorphobacter sp. PAMC 29334]
MTRCGTVAVVGAPNAGKSTLVNTLVGQKVAIVSAKVQTTRTRLMGIAVEGDAQLLLVDTPGIFAPRRRLDRAMVRAAWDGAHGADVVLLVVDAKSGLKDDARAIMASLADRPEPKMLALNKVDIASKPRLLDLANEANAAVKFAETFFIAAETGDGVPELKAALGATLPEGEWHYPADQLVDATTRLMAAEITREQLYNRLHAELPYASTVETEKWEDRKDGSTVIHQQILVQRDSQKAIILGAKGSMIKAIGEAARGHIATLTGRKVHLFLHVKVKADWADDRAVFRDIGLDWVE